MIDPGQFSSQPWRPPPIRRVGEDGEPVGAAVSINGRDFSFDPRSFDFRPETGGAQHGRSICVRDHCDCMFMVNTYRWDYPLIAALIAPRPLLVGNTDAD